MNYIILLMGFALSARVSPAQTMVRGIVKDQRSQPIANATITLQPPEAGRILSFCFSDEAGRFSLSCPATAIGSLVVKVSMLGYTDTLINLRPGEPAHLDITLRLHATELPKFVVKSNPVRLRGDTISYDAREFAQKQDMVVGDIVKRLPGIEVAPNGQIKYNGKPISKYYIDGLDLLEDKYSIANNNIPSDAVDKVQILENHQPIRVLDSIAFSDRAAINIKLRPDARLRLLGRLKAAAGGGDGFSSDDEVNAMLFKKGIQFLDTYKYNNFGVDNSRELLAQNLADYINAIQNGAVKNDLLYPPATNPPSTDDRRYLFNNQHVVSINQLMPVNSSYQLRVNADYVHDRQEQNSNTTTRYFLPGDTITVREDQALLTRTDMLQTNLTLTANEPNFFLKDMVHYQGWWGTGDSRLLSDSPISQTLKNPYFHFDNDFRLIRSGAKGIIEYSSYIGQTQLPQSLSIVPGQYPALLNGGAPYPILQQNASLRTFYTDNSISWKHKKRRWSEDHRLGWNEQSQAYLSDLAVVAYPAVKQDLPDSFQNHLHWLRTRVYTENQWSYDAGKLRFSAELPVNYTLIDYHDTALKVSTHKNKFFVNPKLTLWYYFNPYSNASLSAGYTANFGDISNAPAGYVLHTYRNLSNNDAPLAQTEAMSLAATYTYRNPLKIVFFNLGLNLTRTRWNLLYSQQFVNALETKRAILQDNYQDNLNVFGRWSKYILRWKASLAGSVSYTIGDQRQLQQGIPVQFINQNLDLNASLTLKLAQWLAPEYGADYLWYASHARSGGQQSSASTLKQHFALNFYPAGRWLLKLSGEDDLVSGSQTGNTAYFFLDAGLRYSIPKPRIGFELNFRNLLNTRSFVNTTVSNGTAIISNYQMRPFEYQAKIYYTF